MKDNTEHGAGPLRRRDGAPGDSSQEGPREGFQNGGGTGDAPRNESFWVVLDLLAHRWHWLLIGCIIFAGFFCALGWYVVKPKFTATAKLLRYETPGKSDYFKTSPLTGETLAAMIRAPELLHNVGQMVMPPLPEDKFAKCIKVEPEVDSDVVSVAFMAREPRYAVTLLNLYITNAVEYTRQLEAQQSGLLANEYLKKQVADMEQDVKDVREQFRKMPVGDMTNLLAQVGGQVGALGTNINAGPRPSMLSFAQQAEMLQKAQSELYDLLLKYTEAHPTVQAKRRQVDDLEKRFAEASTNQNAVASGLIGSLASKPGERLNPELEVLGIKLKALEDGRVELRRRQREAQMYAEHPTGSLRVFAPAELSTVKSNMRWVKISLVSVFGGIVGLCAGIGLVLLVELIDRRVKTPDDLKRVTGLPVLTALGDLNEMKPEARSDWAFRAWTMLQGRLSPTPNYGLVCGITSSTEGEGRSTWISLLAEAASMTGYRVLTIATRPSPSHVHEQISDSSPSEHEQCEPEAERQVTGAHVNGNGNGHSHALTTNVLSSPSQVTDKLVGPNSQPVVHIPLPGWVWNLERRKQWREALNQWRQIDNLVILVELPPAGVPESVLLGSNLPNLVWLADSGKANATETRTQMETLRYARCNLVGAVLNHSSAVPIRKLFPRWLS